MLQYGGAVRRRQAAEEEAEPKENETELLLDTSSAAGIRGR